MNLLWIILLSLLIGLVAGGFVWFAWGLLENLYATRGGAKHRLADAESTAETETDQSAGTPE